MQRVKFSLACLLSLCLTGPALAQGPINEDLGVATLDSYSGGVSYGGAFFDVRTMTGDGVGYRNGFTQIGGSLPIWVTEDMYIAPQARLLLTDTSEVGVNLGTLVRRYSADMDRVFGVYGFYDHDNSAEGFEYSQFGFGFDTLGEVVDFRANAYLPTTEDVNFVRPLRINPNDPIFFGNALGFNGVALFQEAVSGGDFEFGIPLTKRTPWLRGYAGAYAYEAEKNSPVGVRGRIEAWISNDLSVGVNVTDDDNFGTNVNAVVDFRFSGWQATRYFPNWTVRERMMMPIQRNYRVATTNTERDIPVAAKNPATGQPYFIVHVDASNFGPGDGTFENPFSSLPGSAPGADIILVQRDGTSIINPLSGSITLEDNQRMLGEGKAHLADVSVMFGPIMFEDTIQLPGIETDGNFPFLTSPGNIITLADNNEVSAFNLINAGGFAVTNTAAGSNNFHLNCLNITGNAGGIFLSDATGTGILNMINALNNPAGGISIDSGNAPLNLTGTNLVSSSLPVGVQAFGMRLTASNGQINAVLDEIEFNRNVDGLLINGTTGDVNLTMTDANLNDNTTDGIRVVGNTSDILLNLQRVVANRNLDNALDADLTGGSLTILGRNDIFNDSGNDNVDITLVNSRMAIDFQNSTFNSSVNGSGFVLSSSGGGGTGTLLLDNIAASGNDVDGVRILGDNFANFDADIRTAVISNNGRDALSVITSNSANVDLDVTAVFAEGSGRHGLNFNATTDSNLSMTILGSTFDLSGSDAALAGNGVNGFADDANVDLTMIAATASQAGNNGMFVNAVNDAQVNISVAQGNFSDSAQNTAGGDGVNIVTDTGADVVLQITNTPINNTAVVPGGTQDDGLVFDSSNGSTVLANISNLSLANNLSNAIQATVDTTASVTLNLLNITATGSGEDGILFDVQTDGQLAINSQTGNFDDSGAAGTGDGIDGFIRTGGDVTFNWVATTVRRSAENGFLLDISDAGSTFNGGFQSGDFSDSGESQLGVGQQDAFNVTAANDSVANFTLFNTPSRNNFVPPAGTQQRGLRGDISTGADFTFTNQSGDMSNNLLNAINMSVTNAGSTAVVTLTATPANNSGEDGVIFDVTDSGDLTINLTDSTLDSSGSLGIVGDDFDGIDGLITTNGVVTLNLTNTPVTNANNDGMQIIANTGGQLNATFDNSDLDFSGTNNEGDAIRLIFSSDADGVVTLLNGTTATNAGDDAVFISATDLGTTVVLNVTDSDLSDSGLTLTAGGGNGIRALVSNDAVTLLDIENTLITNTNPNLPQQRGLFFDVTTGGLLLGLFDTVDMSGHFLEGINGNVDGTGVNDSTAVLSLTDTLVDANGTFGALFNVTNEGDLGLLTSGATSFSNNGTTGIFANVDGAGSAALDTTFTFGLEGTNIDGNGNPLGGDGFTIIGDNGAAIFGQMDTVSISNNNNGGFVLSLDNGSVGDLGLTTLGLVDVTIDGNGNEGMNVTVNNLSELDLAMLNGSISNNGTAGTAGDLTNSFDNVRVQASNTSDVEVLFAGTTADGATRNGFNFISTDSTFVAQLRAGVSASNNTGGSGVRMVGTGPFAPNPSAGVVLWMSDDFGGGVLTGTNAFDGNGTDLIADATDPLDGQPQSGAGVFFNALNVNLAGIRVSGGADGNGNPADPLLTRDIDGDGDGDDDGVYINIERTIAGTTAAAVELAGPGAISNNVDQGIDLMINEAAGTINLVALNVPSELTPPTLPIGIAGPGILIEDLTLDGNGGGIFVDLDGIDLGGADLIVRNNSITNNADGAGLLLDLNGVTGLDEIIIQNNDISGNGTNDPIGGHGVDLQLTGTNTSAIRFLGAVPQSISGNGLDGVHFEFVNSNIGAIQFDNNTISNNGVLGLDGDGVGYDLVTNSNVGPNTFTNNTINGNQADGVSVVGVAPAGGLWLFTFDQNLSISGNQGRGVNFVLLNGLSDLALTMTDNAGINNNTLGGINITADQNNDVFLFPFFGNTVSGNGGPGLLVTADDGSDIIMTIGDSTEAANTFDDNDDAGIALDIVGTSEAVFGIENTTISSTNDGATYGGDGLAIRLNEAAQIPGGLGVGLTIGDSVLANTTFTENAGDGMSIFMDATSQLINPIVQNSTFSNNGADGLNVNRQGSAVINNFVIGVDDGNVNTFDNRFTGNGGDGIDLTASFALLVDEYAIIDNQVTGNSQNGIRFTAAGDGQISTVLTNNRVEQNLDDGVLITTVTVSAGDAARVVSSAAWTGNSFSLNGNSAADAGIDIEGIHSLLIGVNDGNPLTFSNTFVSNTGDGIEVDGVNFLGGNLTITDANIALNNTSGTGNGLAGVDINGPFNFVNINNSRIFQNQGDGVEIDNTTNTSPFRSTYTLTDNIISFNGRDGVEFVASGDGILTIGGTNTTLSQITDNGTSGTGGRGVDIIAGGSDITFATVNINNTSILRNAQEGVYAVLTASATQGNAANRDNLASVAMQTDGVLTSTPFLQLNVGNTGGNIINNNGQPGGNIGGSGLVLRVGTTRGGDGTTTAGGFSSGGNGGVDANVANNQLVGNFGADVFIQSFVSIANSGNSGTAWTDQNENPRNFANDVYNPAGYQSDPLARLDLIFNNNTGEELAGTNVGASYNNNDPVFKSRGTTGVGPDTAADAGADDDGPFGSGSRVRNAQRLAARNVGTAGAQLPPLLAIGASDTFLFPGLGESTFRVQGAGNAFGAGNGFILDGAVFDDTVVDANGVGGTFGGPFGIDNVSWGWGVLP
jgi:hypothetical protein